jgi:hypothetical protein
MGLRCEERLAQDSRSINGLQRFHSCYIPKPLLPSGIFLKKMPPSAV